MILMSDKNIDKQWIMAACVDTVLKLTKFDLQSYAEDDALVKIEILNGS